MGDVGYCSGEHLSTVASPIGISGDLDQHQQKRSLKCDKLHLFALRNRSFGFEGLLMSARSQAHSTLFQPTL